MRQWHKTRKPNIFWYKTKKGKRFAVRRQYRDNGKRADFNRSGFTNQIEAETVLKQFETTLLTDGPSVLRGKKITVEAYYNQLVERKMKLKTWRESTRKNNKNYFDNYLRPVFGSTPLDDVSRSSYQHFLDDLAIQKNQKGELRLSETTINTIHSIMMMIFNSAEADDTIRKNRLRGLSVNGRKPRSQDLDRADFEKWLAVAKQKLDRYEYAMIRIGALGERRGELMGLRTTSITFQHDDVHNEEVAAIKFDLQRNAEMPNGSPLKTDSSYRTIWVSGDIVDMLHFAIMTANNIRIRKGRVVDEVHKPWLWVNEDGEPLHYTHINRLTSRVNKWSSISIHPHLLRHYVASQATAHKASGIDIMHYLGHKNLQMTADYTRSTKESSLNVFEAVEGKPEKNNG
ncbi:tyrosine-type recombinase/integrase [Lacticaseibacillus rhamnosus]|uniref:tyrosine-type recombinase/integrase n=1 Tax=Lacticaseibacillus rhamnosus TaxID=47715 RepID=UPI00062A49A2|nr:site-specific integrase [Lacticaseibacillus rhamnosus]KKW88338.1 hypothetical protein XA20_04700 [Lacticaseibacillus rhamnosus]MCZ2733610.1 tyrosine-type recombinase/integrase [Lacticaseibacillus rhamnosus]MCZ2736293.1 tyrosine-type recombinase/integrase [Lacticaseibacillus rhamnosus]MCZ2742633.1 tyrosine-type recombinase/integrase [Lacticaseibacillus rhamnosus]MCZ2745377.1 tyrosine-type recombinase/integrase [Lacticaseibacillus rhamnosus]